MLNLGTRMTEEEIAEMIKNAPVDASGLIDIVQFCEDLCPAKPDPKASKKGKKGKK